MPLSPGQGWLRIAVSDSGTGIAAAKQQQIFDSFTQEDVSTTRGYGGTGLGLTICSRIVELMGGTIKVESEAGQGSRFPIDLPLKLGAEPAPPGSMRCLPQRWTASNSRVLTPALTVA
jgi:signal transduction histidine kinase